MGLWVQDLYSLGVVETGGPAVAAKPLKALERGVFRTFDGVVAAHPRFRTFLTKEFNIPDENVQVIPNWTRISSTANERDNERRKLGWLPKEFICLHAGNMGVKQGLENVVETARLAERSDPSFRFVFIGGGNQEAALRERAQGLRNIDFIPSLPDQDFGSALAAADVLLVNERAGVREMSVPSKMTNYFASGRPVLAAVAHGSVTAEEIARAGAGITVAPSSPAALIDGIRLLVAQPALCDRLGKAGGEFVANFLSEEAALEAFELWLQQLARQSLIH